MNPAAILSLLSDLYAANAAQAEQLTAAHKEIERLTAGEKAE